MARTIVFAHLAFVLAQLLWGAAGPVIKLTLQEIPPITFLFLRFLVVCILLLPYTMYEVMKQKVSKKDYLNLFLLGLFSQTAIVIVFFALKYTHVIDYTVISIIGFILSIYAGHYFYKDKVHKGLTIGLVLASIGTFIVILEPLVIGGHDTIPVGQRLLGNMLGLLYSLTFTVYVVWSKMSTGDKSKKLKKTLSFIHLRAMTKNYSPTLIVALTFYVGLLTMVPLVFVEHTGVFGSIGT